MGRFITGRLNIESVGKGSIYVPVIPNYTNGKQKDYPLSFPTYRI